MGTFLGPYQNVILEGTLGKHGEHNMWGFARVVSEDSLGVS